MTRVWAIGYLLSQHEPYNHVQANSDELVARECTHVKEGYVVHFQQIQAQLDQ